MNASCLAKRDTRGFEAIRWVLSVYAFIKIEEYTDSTIFERGKKREF